MSLLKIKIQRADFFYLISQAHSIIEKRNIMPILSKVIIQATETHISIKATDQDNSLQSQVSANVLEEGQIVIDAQNLYDILKELPEGEIDFIELKGNKIKLKQGSSIFNLLGLNVKDFPIFPSFQMTNSFFIKKENLKNLIEKTAYCSSTDETRYHLTGVFFDIVKSISKKDILCFRFVATDGHRLSLTEYPCDKPFFKKGVIISKKGIQEIKKIITSFSSSKEVEISLNSTKILFRYDNTVLSVKLVEGTYPNYQPLIPTSYNVSLNVNTEQFSQSLKRVSLLSNNRYKGVNFNIKKDTIEMEAENPELGSAQDTIPCMQKTGEDIQVRFNARYVLEVLNYIDTKKVCLEFKNKDTPCVIRPHYEEKNTNKQYSLSVVMPMKL